MTTDINDECNEKFRTTDMICKRKYKRDFQESGPLGFFLFLVFRFLFQINIVCYPIVCMRTKNDQPKLVSVECNIIHTVRMCGYVDVHQ